LIACSIGATTFYHKTLLESWNTLIMDGLPDESESFVLRVKHGTGVFKVQYANLKHYAMTASTISEILNFDY